MLSVCFDEGLLKYSLHTEVHDLLQQKALKLLKGMAIVKGIEDIKKVVKVNQLWMLLCNAIIGGNLHISFTCIVACVQCLLHRDGRDL